MALALIGVASLQLYQFNKAWALSRANFQSNVQDALDEVVEQLHTTAIQTRFVRVSRELNIQAAPYGDSTSDAGAMPLADPEDMDMPGYRKVRIRDSLAIIREEETYISLESSPMPGDELSYVYVASGETDTSDLAMELRGNPRVLELMGRTLDGLSSLQQDVEQRLSEPRLDSLLEKALIQQGIFLEPKFIVQSPEGRRLVNHKGIFDDEVILSSPNRVQLFPYVSGPDPSYLYVFFPDQPLHLLSKVWLQVGLSLLFSAIMLFGFFLFIRTIFRQKRLSEMKNDFINNMTHELKTPIATISLAADAIANPRIQSSAESLNRYARIIREENQRMHRQVERVLLAARFDSQQIDLHNEKVDMADLIQKAVDTVRLQVEERKGSISLDLKAPSHTVIGDRVHLSNMVLNLLDNANKYSPETPLIAVTSDIKNGRMRIAITDHGIGIASQNQEEIFTRFYRVSTGNRHEVKGFGLGLSYVREMMEAHGGMVTLKSTPGKGSTFTLHFPLSES